jgi:thiamine-monophosphate kinase
VPQSVFEQARLRMEMPTPRLALGQALRGIATAAADISDGLLGDLQHILKASHVGADLDTSQVLSTLASRAMCNLPLATQRMLTLSGGDDYELVFTAPEHARAAIATLSDATDTPITRIGKVNGSQQLRLLDSEGHVLPNEFESFDHFKSN